jgi:hypothetical protein
MWLYRSQKSVLLDQLEVALDERGNTRRDENHQSSEKKESLPLAMQDEANR